MSSASSWVTREGCQVSAFSPDGQLLASAANDGMVKVWDVGSGRCKFNLGRQGRLRAWRNSVVSAAFSPDGKSLATAGVQSVTIWNLATAQADAGPPRPYQPGSTGRFSSQWRAPRLGRR